MWYDNLPKEQINGGWNKAFDDIAFRQEITDMAVLSKKSIMEAYALMILRAEGNSDPEPVQIRARAADIYNAEIANTAQRPVGKFLDYLLMETNNDLQLVLDLFNFITLTDFDVSNRMEHSERAKLFTELLNMVYSHVLDLSLELPLIVTEEIDRLGGVGAAAPRDMIDEEYVRHPIPPRFERLVGNDFEPFNLDNEEATMAAAILESQESSEAEIERGLERNMLEQIVEDAELEQARLASVQEAIREVQIGGNTSARADGAAFITPDRPTNIHFFANEDNEDNEEVDEHAVNRSFIQMRPSAPPPYDDGEEEKQDFPEPNAAAASVSKEQPNRAKVVKLFHGRMQPLIKQQPECLQEVLDEALNKFFTDYTRSGANLKPIRYALAELNTPGVPGTAQADEIFDRYFHVFIDIANPELAQLLHDCLAQNTDQAPVKSEQKIAPIADPDDDVDLVKLADLTRTLNIGFSQLQTQSSGILEPMSAATQTPATVVDLSTHEEAAAPATGNSGAAVTPMFTLAMAEQERQKRRNEQRAAATATAPRAEGGTPPGPKGPSIQ